MYAVGDVERLMTKIKNFGLEAPEEMLSAEATEFAKICNGIGCEHIEHITQGEKKAIGKIMGFAECSAAIHDWCYAHSDGTEESRKKADKMFRRNMLDEIEERKVRFKWFRQWVALRAYATVRKYGRSDWCIAFAERQTEGK